jgi:sRNA-binding protein
VSQTDKRAVNAIHALLMDQFPLAFPQDYDAIRPLKVGILADVIERLPGIDPGLLRRVLANHTSRDGYWLTLTTAGATAATIWTASRPAP